MDTSRFLVCASRSAHGALRRWALALLCALLLLCAPAATGLGAALHAPGTQGESAAMAAPAALKTYTFTLSGAAESTPNSSTATGSGYVTIDTAAMTMTVSVVFSGLAGNSTAAHIHSATAQPGTGTAGVATTTPSFAGFPLGVTSGTFLNTLDMTQAGSYNPVFVTNNGGTTASAFAALVAGIDGGMAYFNIHSTVYAGGEIRGFLLPQFRPRLFLPLVRR